MPDLATHVLLKGKPYELEKYFPIKSASPLVIQFLKHLHYHFPIHRIFDPTRSVEINTFTEMYVLQIHEGTINLLIRLCQLFCYHVQLSALSTQIKNGNDFAEFYVPLINMIKADVNYLNKKKSTTTDQMNMESVSSSDETIKINIVEYIILLGHYCCYLKLPEICITLGRTLERILVSVNVYRLESFINTKENEDQIIPVEYIITPSQLFKKQFAYLQSHSKLKILVQQ